MHGLAIPEHPSWAGHTILELTPGMEDSIFDKFDAALRTRVPQMFEDYISSRDLWVHAEAFPTQRPRQVAVIFSDINERKRVEAALRESERRLSRELEGTVQLQKISSLLIEEKYEDALYGSILDVSIAIMHADFGSIQMLHPQNNGLRLLAWRNFHPDSANLG